MRTGYADLADAVAASVRSDCSARRRWIDAACGGDPFGGETRQRYLLTDAPGLALELQQRYPRQVVSSVAASEYSARRVEQTRAATRTWKAPPEVMRAVYDDVVAAGWSSAIQVAPQRTAHRRDFQTKRRAFGRVQTSRFWVAVAARSMCLDRCDPAVPQCASYAEIFFRDLPLLLEVKQLPTLSMIGWARNATRFARLPAPLERLPPLMAARRWHAMQAEMPAAHPCKQGTIHACVQSFASALTPVDGEGGPSSSCDSLPQNRSAAETT